MVTFSVHHVGMVTFVKKLETLRRFDVDGKKGIIGYRPKVKCNCKVITTNPGGAMNVGTKFQVNTSK